MHAKELDVGGEPPKRDRVDKEIPTSETTDGPNALPAFSDACTSNCDLPQITVEDIKDCSEKKNVVYIGLTDYSTYNTLFDCLMQKRADSFVLDTTAMEKEIDKGEPKLRMSSLRLRCDHGLDCY